MALIRKQSRISRVIVLRTRVNHLLLNCFPDIARFSKKVLCFFDVALLLPHWLGTVDVLRQSALAVRIQKNWGGPPNLRGDRKNENLAKRAITGGKFQITLGPSCYQFSRIKSGFRPFWTLCADPQNGPPTAPKIGRFRAALIRAHIFLRHVINNIIGNSRGGTTPLYPRKGLSLHENLTVRPETIHC